MPIRVPTMRIYFPICKPCHVAAIVLCLVFGMFAGGCGLITSARNDPAATPEVQPEASETDDETPEAGLSGDPAEPAAVTSTPAPVAEPTDGYRVQLYSFTNREAAEAALERVKRTLEEWSYGVYLQEETGSFKVRVGDFVVKEDADLLRDWFREKGFVDAWTASTLVHAP
ncbi:MAG: SPOR domain-containing protein [Gemmatimonadetes bacterium]|nr:SPOR domain-containing protein [Gemmatimonadota bacterium]